MKSSIKRLRSLTVIPSALYVKRGADEQLKSVVEDMGRPGYVLVARQMGKTNLLLNAKRELGTGDDLFLYVDLSNTYPTLQQFFRSIVDTALDSHPEIFDSVSVGILERRKNSGDTPAHKEHEQELRRLLSATGGKIIICLDEIDALSKLSYSDNVFSLIRSTYFASRINFEEFNRLTYILSGVAEPAEIIKNKDISPFNIGEKIYLDDFTFSEFHEFLFKAHLTLSEDVVNRVYYWTSGNPRMCWDLCSVLEDRLLSDKIVSVDDVDLAVRKLYLTSYDLPPVDHIRQLVEDDKDIRTAIMNIHYQKYASITDVQRTRLYLAGVVKADFLSNEVRIKNRVIEASLSEDWISTVEEQKLSLIERGDEKLAERNYSAALEFYLACANDAAIKDKLFLYHNIGECCLYLGNYQGVVDYINQAPAKRSSFALMYYRQQVWLGIANFQLGNIDISLEHFDAVIGADYSDGYSSEYFEALVNRSAAYFERFEKFGLQIVDDSRRVIDLVNTVDNIDVILMNTLKCAAYSNMAEASQKLGEVERAAQILQEAIESASPASKPSLIARLIEVLPQDKWEELLRIVSNLIESGEISVKPDSLRDRFTFNIQTFAELLLRSLEIKNDEVWKRMLGPLTRGDVEGASVAEVLQMVIVVAYSKGKRSFIVPAFLEFLPFASEVDVESLRTLFYYCLAVNGESNVQIEQAFCKFFGGLEASSISQRDLLLVYILADRYLGMAQFSKVNNLLSLAKRKQSLLLRDEIDEELSIAFVALDFLYLSLVAAEKKFDLAVDLALEVKTRLPMKVPASSVFAEDFFSGVRAEINRLTAFAVRPTQVRNGRKWGRNDVVECRYANGNVRKGKFKALQADIEAGHCEIIG